MASGQRLSVDAPAHCGDCYCWTPRPFNIWVALPPVNPLQERVLRMLQTRLEDRGCLFIDPPDTPTSLGPVAHLGLGFARTYEEEISPLEFLTMLPKPRGQGMVISTVASIPEGDPFDIGRSLIVRKAGHVGILVEGDEQSGEIRRILWVSMAGNNKIVEGSPDAIMDSIALRTLVHIGSEHLTGHHGDDTGRITWADWCASPIHAEMAEAARALGAAGIIEDQVPLGNYGTSQQVRHVLSYLNRSALGEGMRSQVDLDLRVMGVTTTGGGKINLSPDPNDGQIVPVGGLTWSGFVRALPAGCPINFNAPSVETHENGMIYLASSLVNAGLVDSFDTFYDYLVTYFAGQEAIDIIPEGMDPAVRMIDHFHRQPKDGSIKDPSRIEVVYPDFDRFPAIDFPCGVREAELNLLSALFKSEAFRTPGPLNRVVMAMLPGHGAVALYSGPRRELTDLLINGLVLEDVERV